MGKKPSKPSKGQSAPGQSEPDVWRSLSGNEIEDVIAEVTSLLDDDERVIHVGTDSKNRGPFTDFVTVIVVLNPGRGGRVYYRRERVKRAPSLPVKLLREAEMSIEVANTLSQSVAHDIVVHVDANEDARHRSSDYVQMLAGMVVGHGFKVQLKPASWCATHVADHVVKEKHQRPAA